MNSRSSYRRKSLPKKILAGIGLGAGGVIVVVAVFLFVLFLYLAATSFLVALIWNWCGVHNLADAGPLSFWKVVGVAGVINILRSIFHPNVSVTKSG